MCHAIIRARVAYLRTGALFEGNPFYFSAYIFFMSSITAHTGALALFATGFVSGYLVSKWTSGSGYESDDDVSDLEDGDEDDSSSSSEPCKMVCYTLLVS